MIQYKIKSADFSDCKKYRYCLTRIWDDTLPYAMCIGLNPSNAGSDKDDATIIILVKALKKLGYGGLKMVNLYSCITSKPKNIFDFLNPEDSHYAWIKITALACQSIVFCWGTFKQAEHRSRYMKKLFPQALCFGKNQNGSPWHPRALTYAGIKPEDAILMKF